MKSKKNILIIQKIHEDGIKLIKNNPNFQIEITDDLSIENLKTKIKNVDAVSIRTAKLSGDIIENAKNLKVISRHGVGYDNIALNKAKEKKIKITITADSNAVTVAEHVMFVLLNLAKRKNLYDKTVRDGNFKDRNKLPKTIEIWKKNFLIIGFGRIGKALIKRCLGFEMNIFVYDPFIEASNIEELGGKKIENLSESIKIMDVISLHVPLTDKTENLINYDLMKLMKKNCIIINSARGGIINEKDLDKALNESLIFGAAIDVFKKEPPDENNPLLKNKKVYLSPHTAAFTEECMIRMSKETVQNIIDFFDKKLDNSKIIKL